MSQEPQGFGAPVRGAGGFPPAPSLSRDNPGQLIPARPGFLPGALPNRGGVGPVKHARGTVPASAAMSGLVNGLPFGGLATPPPPAAEPYAASPPGEVAQPPMVVAQPAPTPSVPDVVAPPPVVVPPAVVASAPVVPPPLVVAPVADAPPATPVVSGFAPVAPPQGPKVAQPSHPAPADQPNGTANGSVSSPGMVAAPAMLAVQVTPPMGSSAVASVEPPPRIGPIGESQPAPPALVGSEPPQNISSAPGNASSEPAAAESPWMMEKALPPVPTYSPEPVDKAPKSIPAAKQPSSKAPFVIIALLLVLGGGGFAVYRFVLTGAPKAKTDDSAIKIAAPNESAVVKDEPRDPGATASASSRPPPQLASGTVVPHEPVAPPTVVAPKPPSAGAGQTPPSTPGPGKFDPQGI